MKASLLALFFAAGAGLTGACRSDPECFLDDECEPRFSCYQGACVSSVLLIDAGQIVPTWAADIAPIVQDSCQPCHTNPPTNGAPFPLLTYQDTQNINLTGQPIFARMAARVLDVNNPMPPRGQPGLTDTEIFLIRRWAELGAPVGSSGGDGGIGGATDGGVVGNDGGPPTGPLAGATAPARLAGGYGQVGGFFWIPGDNALLFTDVSASAVFRLLLPSQVTPEFNMTGGMRALAGDGTGNLLATEWTNRRVSITAVGAQPQVVTDAYNGSAFNAPHDLVTANDGQVYFTDPAFGLDGRMRELSFNGLFRIDLQGMPNLEWQGTPSSGPNGVALSPDNSALYMTDTVDGLLLAFTVDPTLGSLSPPRLLLVPGARPTGLAVDTDGNLYVGTAGGVEVYSAAGQLYGTLRTPEPVDNVGWAGNSLDVLVMAVGGALYGAQVNASGQP